MLIYDVNYLYIDLNLLLYRYNRNVYKFEMIQVSDQGKIYFFSKLILNTAKKL